MSAQSLALAYAMKKRAKKALGREACDAGCPGCPKCKGGMMAEGGEVDSGPSISDFFSSKEERDQKKAEQGRKDPINYDTRIGKFATGGFVEEEKASGYPESEYVQADEPAEMIGQNAHGGMIEDDDDLIDRIMKSRKGEPVADFEQNDFDELDQTSAGHEADYTGENSGDEDGDAAEDEDRRDIVSRIMKSRAKKDRMPRPA
jgi:hypothetical protein